MNEDHKECSDMGGDSCFINEADAAELLASGEQSFHK